MRSLCKAWLRAWQHRREVAQPRSVEQSTRTAQGRRNIKNGNGCKKVPAFQGLRRRALQAQALGGNGAANRTSPMLPCAWAPWPPGFQMQRKGGRGGQHFPLAISVRMSRGNLWRPAVPFRNASSGQRALRLGSGPSLQGNAAEATTRQRRQRHDHRRGVALGAPCRCHASGRLC